jgi:hypothetical protein
MNRAASSLLIALASLTLTAAALAQTASPPATHPGISKLQLPQDSPDASLPSATKVTISGMVIVGGGKTTASQKLNLRVTNFINRRAITSAQITVHGLTAHGRISPASFRDSEADTVSKQVDLTLTVAPGASA